jgi:hypothetical protein
MPNVDPDSQSDNSFSFQHALALVVELLPIATAVLGGLSGGIAGIMDLTLSYSESL